MRDINELLTDYQRNELTGNRLWINKLKQCPGIAAEKISFITYGNIEADYLLKFDFFVEKMRCTPAILSYKWTPGAITTEYAVDTLRLIEKKYINADDTGVVVLDIENRGNKTVLLNYRADTLLTELKKQARAIYNPCFVSYDNRGSDVLAFGVHLDCIARNVLKTYIYAQFRYYIADAVVSKDNDSYEGSLSIEPGKHQSIKAVFTCYLVDECEYSVNKLKALVKSRELTNHNSAAIQRWFEKNVPEFICSDDALERLYHYRWYVVLKNTIKPGVDCFKSECMYEGKDQFSQICTASAAMQIREARWMKTGSLALSQLKTLLSSQIKEGIDTGRFRDMYLNDIPHTAWETVRILGCQEYFKELFEPLRQFVDWETSDIFVKDASHLPLVIGSWRTAAEYQPSFFEFTDPPWDHTQSNPFRNEHKTSVHRVEEAVYAYQNLTAISKMAESLGFSDLFSDYNTRATELKKSIIQNMWDDKTKFYYDLCPHTLQKALKSKNFAGFLPARCDIADSVAEKLFDHLSAEFDTPYPIPSTATDSPAFSPDNTWRIGPHASEEVPYHYDCCWNGPTWNYSNSLVIDALGSYIQRSNSKRLSAVFSQLFHKWCTEQSTVNGIPNSCEHYDPYTGIPLRDVKDYFHSAFIDVVIKYIVGISVEADGRISLDPIDIGVGKLIVRGILVTGRSLDFEWDTSKENQKFIVRINGKVVFSGNSLTKTIVQMRGQNDE